MIKKILSMLICAATVLALASCGGTPAETEPPVTYLDPINCVVTVKIAATEKKGEEVLIDNQPITLRNRTEVPSSLDALAQACSAYEIKYSSSEDGTTVGSIKNHANFASDSEGGTWFWELTVNGKTPSGKAGEVEVKEGDVYVFTYSYIGGTAE